jgi:hypothetical protein
LSTFFLEKRKSRDCEETRASYLNTLRASSDENGSSYAVEIWIYGKAALS